MKKKISVVAIIGVASVLSQGWALAGNVTSQTLATGVTLSDTVNPGQSYTDITPANSTVNTYTASSTAGSGTFTSTGFSTCSVGGRR